MNLANRLLWIHFQTLKVCFRVFLHLGLWIAMRCLGRRISHWKGIFRFGVWSCLLWRSRLVMAPCVIGTVWRYGLDKPLGFVYFKRSLCRLVIRSSCSLNSCWKTLRILIFQPPIFLLKEHPNQVMIWDADILSRCWNLQIEVIGGRLLVGGDNVLLPLLIKLLNSVGES